MWPQVDNGEEDGQRIISPSIWRVLCFLYVLCIPHAVSLHNATLARSMLISMPAGDASQTTPVQIMQVYVLCCSTQIAHVATILIPVRVLHVT